MRKPKEEIRADSFETVRMEPPKREDAEDSGGQYYLAAIVVMFIVYQLAPRPILYNHLIGAAKDILLFLP